MAAPRPEQIPALAMSGVRFAWPGRAFFSLAVPELRLAQGSRTLLLGASGSGKSTLLALICGIAQPQAGEIHVAGARLDRLGAARRDRFRAEHIGVIFQQFNLLPYATALDNVLLPLRFAPARRARAGEARSEALRLGAALGLEEALMTGGPAGALSVGQQQRVAVARALIGAPELIVADEPTSALDEAAQEAFLDLLFAQCRAAGATLLMVSHDARIGARFDRVLDLADIAETRIGAPS